MLSDKLSSSKKKSYFGTSQTNGDVIPAILIGQLGKNEAVKTDFSGSDLMNLVFRYICKVDSYLPSLVSYVEHDGNPKLIKFYESNGFSYLYRPTEEKNKHLYCHVIKTEDIISLFE